VVLCSKPTTGLKWSETARIDNQAVLEQTDHRFLPPAESNTSSAGSAGKEVWIFHTIQKGKCILSMMYSQPWEGGRRRFGYFYYS